jgi:hypothetical protein
VCSFLHPVHRLHTEYNITDSHGKSVRLVPRKRHFRVQPQQEGQRRATGRYSFQEYRLAYIPYISVSRLFLTIVLFLVYLKCRFSYKHCISTNGAMICVWRIVTDLKRSGRSLFFGTVLCQHFPGRTEETVLLTLCSQSERPNRSINLSSLHPSSGYYRRNLPINIS